MFEGEPIGLLLLITLSIPISVASGLSIHDTEDSAITMSDLEESAIVLTDEVA